MVSKENGNPQILKFFLDLYGPEAKNISNFLLLTLDMFQENIWDSNTFSKLPEAEINLSRTNLNLLEMARETPPKTMVLLSN